MKAGECVHWRGLTGRNLRSLRCGAGVCYFDAFNGDQPGLAQRLPCRQFEVVQGQRKPPDRGLQAEGVCLKLRLPTDVELAAEAEAPAARRAAFAQRMAAAWRAPGVPGWERRALLGCSVCEGRLHLRQSAVDGKVQIECETAGCLKWTE